MNTKEDTRKEIIGKLNGTKENMLEFLLQYSRLGARVNIRCLSIY